MGAQPSGFMNRNVNNAGYMIGTWTPGEQFKPETEFRLWDCGHNYYAPQSFNDGKRQIVYGWMSPFVEPIPMQDDGWCGNLTLPREITLGADGDLHTAPVAEMEGLREDTVDFGAIDLDVSGEKTIVDDAEAMEIEMTIDLANSTAERAGLRVHATEDGAYTSVAYDDQIGRVVVDRQANAQGDRGYRTAPLSEAELARRRTQAARVRGPWLRGGVRQRRPSGAQLVQLRVRRSARHQARGRIRHAQGQVPGASPHEVHRTGMIDVCHG